MPPWPLFVLIGLGFASCFVMGCSACAVLSSCWEIPYNMRSYKSKISLRAAAVKTGVLVGRKGTWPLGILALGDSFGLKVILGHQYVALFLPLLFF